MTTFTNISYIATQPITAATGFNAIEAASGDLLEGTFANNTIEHVELAVKSAAEAFTKYSRTTAQERANFLNTIASEIEARRDDIVARAMLETGLPEARLIGETGRTTGQLRMFAKMLQEGSWVRAVIDTADAQRQPLPKPDIRLTVVPIGPVAVFGASNFPLAFSTAGGDTASALAAGCPVVVKAHGSHPGTSMLVAEAINAAIKSCDMPLGTFSIISSNISRIGVDLVKHPLIKAVGFTGSVGGGRALFDLCKSRSEPIPFYGELGSTNPVFLLPGALNKRLDSIANGFIGSLNMGCGQFCTNPGILVAIKSEDLDSFVTEVKQQLLAVDPQTMLSPAIAKSYKADSESRTSIEGVDIVARGAAANNLQAESMVAKVSALTWLKNDELEHEVFGPFSLIIECDDLSEMQKVVESMHGHLTATIHAEISDEEKSAILLSGLRDKVGRILMNSWPTGVEVCQSMQHGGPYPAATFSPTSVGGRAIDRWVRPVAYQDVADKLLPDELKNDNPLGILRLVDGEYIR